MSNQLYQKTALSQALGSPESGYGPGGVQNPAYQGGGGAQSGQPTSSTMPVGQPQPLGAAANAGGGAGSASWQVAPRGTAAPAGWDAGNWADPKMQSVKYRAGRLAQGVTKPSELGALVNSPQWQAAFPGSTFNGKDWVDFNGALSDGDRGTPVYGIDMLMAADADADTSNGIWWGAPEGGAQGGGSALPAQRTPSASGSSLEQLLVNNSTMPTLEELLQLLQRGQY